MTVQPYLTGFEAEQRSTGHRGLSQWYTPPWLAERLWRWLVPARIPRPLRVLEPAAGRGALVQAVLEGHRPIDRLVAYDVDSSNVEHLRGIGGTEVRHRDFIADPDPGRFDACPMNPPYEGNQDVAFAARALDVSARVGGIFAARILHSAGRLEFWRWTDVRKMAVLTRRPQFGGAHSPMSDFVLLELKRRAHARLQGEPSTCNVQWW